MRKAHATERVARFVSPKKAKIEIEKCKTQKNKNLSPVVRR
jgi:hypothetical protein